MEKQRSDDSSDKTRSSEHAMTTSKFRADGRSNSRSRMARKLYDPIPKPTTDLGFHGVSHKTTFDSIRTRDNRGN